MRTLLPVRLSIVPIRDFEHGGCSLPSSSTGGLLSLPSFHPLPPPLASRLETPGGSSGHLSLIQPAKKRNAASDPPLEANLSLADLNRLIDQRVSSAVLALSSRIDGLQRENEGLLRRCESLDRSVQVLKKEGNWTYSAPYVPWSHWIEQDHDDDSANDATSLVRSIKSRTQSLRSDSVDEVTVRGASVSPILSDNKLDPHWEQLANDIQLCECLPTINLWNVQLDQSTLQMIEASLRQKGITRFDLAHNQFLGGEGVKFAVDVLKSNRSVKIFCWERVMRSTVQNTPVISSMPFWNTRQSVSWS